MKKVLPLAIFALLAGKESLQFLVNEERHLLRSAIMNKKPTYVLILDSEEENRDTQQCRSNIQRLKQKPVDYKKILALAKKNKRFGKKFKKYRDPTFYGPSSIYNAGTDENNWHVKNDEYETKFKSITNISELKDYTMWGDDKEPHYTDPQQGDIGNCYFVASIASTAAFPELIKKAFLTPERNDVGIYAFRFFIRGKPWIITIDDELLVKEYKDNGDNVPVFIKLRNFQIWPALIEKAWAKIMGNYSQSDMGYPNSSLRALTGVPVFSHNLHEMDQKAIDKFFKYLKSHDISDYLFTVNTGGSSDQEQNECGIAEGHSYSVFNAFTLKTGPDSEVDLLIIRNPWGHTHYNSAWSNNDPRWTEELLAQVPMGLDPRTSQEDGIFFMPTVNAINGCLDNMAIAHVRHNEGYVTTWYDFDDPNQTDYGVDSKVQEYIIEVPENHKSFYVTVESYYNDMIPERCIEGDVRYKNIQDFFEGGWTVQHTDIQDLYYAITDNDDDIIKEEWSPPNYHLPIKMKSGKLDAGTYKIVVYYGTWANTPFDQRDYTVGVYSNPGLPIKDEWGNTNMKSTF